MTSILIAAPAVEPLTVADLRAQLRLACETEDGLLADYIKAAREHVERLTGRALVTQGWRLYLDAWPEGRAVRLPVAPVQSINSITIYDATGIPHALSPDKWSLGRDVAPARVKVSLDTGVPSRSMMGAEIEFSAGYGATADAVPEAFKQAIRLLVAHWFEHREEGGVVLDSIPHGVDRLVAPYKVPRL